MPDLSQRGRGDTVQVFDSSRRGLCAVAPESPSDLVRLYVCGITPYDATHMGHAATYVTFDTLQRVLRDAGYRVDYAQNVTDIDDPLLERAERDSIDWRDLAEREIQLFRDDMEALRVIPPRDYIGVVERIAPIAANVVDLLETGAAYGLPAPDAVAAGAHDVYLDLSAAEGFGSVSGWSREQMFEVFADRGGDPDRAGKRDPLDPLLWRAARPGEPSWHADGLTDGRPGWHIECTCIAIESLGLGFDIQGGGIDLLFPHHEMSAVQADALHGPDAFAQAYVHQEMVGLDGAKMSKSKGNLVLVSKLRARGVDPRAIRLVLLDHHYRTAWDWTDAALDKAAARLDAWSRAVTAVSDVQAQHLLAGLRHLLAADLDTPGALRLIDSCLGGSDDAATPVVPGAEDGSGSALVVEAVDALLGVRLEPC